MPSSSAAMRDESRRLSDEQEEEMPVRGSSGKKKNSSASNEPHGDCKPKKKKNSGKQQQHSYTDYDDTEEEEANRHHEPRVAPPPFAALFLPPAIVFAAAGGICIGVGPQWYYLEIGCFVVAAAFVAVTVVLERSFPAVTLRRYIDLLPRTDNGAARGEAAEDNSLVADMKWGIGFHRIPGNATTHRPNGTIFYPTDDPRALTEAHPFLPHGDYTYGANVVADGGAPAFIATNMARSSIIAAQNATAAVAADRLGHDPKHPLILFAHGDVGHQHIYFSFIADMVATGAVVYAVENTDGFAAHALCPPHVDDPTEDMRRVAAGVVDTSGVRHRDMGASRAADGVIDAEDDKEVDEYRRRNYTTRVGELVSCVAFLQSGGAHCALGLVRRAEGGENGLTPVSLMGHSAGGGAIPAMLGELVARHRGEPHMTKVPLPASAEAGMAAAPSLAYIRAAILFDPGPSFVRFTKVLERAGGPALLPPTRLVISGEWAESPDDYEDTARDLGPTRGEVVMSPQTDHMLMTDASYMVPVLAGRHKCARKSDDRRETARLAMASLAFVRAKMMLQQQ